MERTAEEILRHDHVVLTRWRAEELDELTKLIDGSMERLKPWMPWAHAHSRDMTAGYLVQADADWEAGTAYNYAIREAALDGSDVPEAPVLGSCSMMARIGAGGWEIGYWISEQGGGRGLVTMAAAALTRQAFAFPATTHVEIRHDVLNHRSGAVPARLGFRQAEHTHGPDRDTVIWRMDRQAVAAARFRARSA